MPPTRRDVLDSTLAAGLAAAAAGTATRALAQAGAGPTATRSVQTPVLDIGYEDHGPADGTALILLHGFPYDIRSFDGCIAPLAAAGHRVLVPYLRGYGATRFRDPAAPRMAEPRFEEMERRLAGRPTIDVPAIVLRPGATGLGGRPTGDAPGLRQQFTKLVAQRIVEGAGHDLPAHRPDAVAEALLELVS